MCAINLVPFPESFQGRHQNQNKSSPLFLHHSEKQTEDLISVTLITLLAFKEHTSRKMVAPKDLVRQVIQQTWKDYFLTVRFPDGSLADNDDSILERWKETTIVQINQIYGKHVQLSDQDISAYIDEGIEKWKQESGVAAAAPTKSTAAAPTSFSLFASLGAGAGGGGLAAFFSWPMIAEKENEQEIWNALVKVEYLDDVWPDWNSEIRPWIQKRMNSSPEHAWKLHQEWYSKARRQDDSAEVTQLSMDLMENVLIVVDPSRSLSTTAVTTTKFLELGLDMFIDFLIRKSMTPSPACVASLWNAAKSEKLVEILGNKDPRATWLRLYLQLHPLLYRDVGATLDMSILANKLGQDSSDHNINQQKFYALGLISNILVITRVSGFPWEQLLLAHANQSDTPQQRAYQLLRDAVRSPSCSHDLKTLFGEALAALLEGSSSDTASSSLQDAFQKDFGPLGGDKTFSDSLQHYFIK